MEYIKKKFQQVTTTGNTVGGYQIIPDLTASYSMKILLTSKNIDFGYFDVYDDELATGVTPTVVSSSIYLVEGTTTESRLSELEKFTTSTDMGTKYFTSTDISSDGLNVSLSTAGVEYVYYIGGIQYTDDIVSGITSFQFFSTGYTSPNYVNLPMLKDEKEQNIINQPNIDNNVFITRQESSVFENIYRLRNIKFITELEYYAGGGHFNIVNNT